MIVIFLLIPLSILTAAVFLMGFIWAVRSGQYEDTCTPSMRVLAEDSAPTEQGEMNIHSAEQKTKQPGNQGNKPGDPSHQTQKQ